MLLKSFRKHFEGLLEALPPLSVECADNEELLHLGTISLSMGHVNLEDMSAAEIMNAGRGALGMLLLAVSWPEWIRDLYLADLSYWSLTDEGKEMMIMRMKDNLPLRADSLLSHWELIALGWTNKSILGVDQEASG
jgi:hypothetical protein